MNQALVLKDKLDVSNCIEALNCNYRQDVKLFLQWNNDTLPDDPKGFLNYMVKRSNDYIDFKLSENMKAKTLNRYRVSLKAFILKALQAEFNPTLKTFIDEKFKAEVKHFKTDNKNISCLSRYEIDKMIEESDTRTALIIKTFFFTGLRCSELCSILLENCKREGAFMKIRYIGKRSKESFCYLPADVYDKIIETFCSKKYLFETLPRTARPGQVKQDKRYYRQNIYALIVKAGRTILNKNITVHSLRHSSATYLLNQRNLSIYTVKEFLHHESIKTTERYLHGAFNPLSVFDLQGAFI